MQPEQRARIVEEQTTRHDAGDAARPTVSAVIISCNDAEVIEPCLRSVIGWVDEIVVVDMHSTDGTREIALRYTDRLLDHDRLTYADPARDFAFAQATSEWIMMLDPDERVTEQLARELRRIATIADVDVVLIPRQDVDFGRAVTSPGTADIAHPRFFRRGVMSWPTGVHEHPDLTGLRCRSLPGDRPELALLHEAWRSVPLVLDRMLRYAPREVEKLQARGEHFSPRTMFGAMWQQVERRMVNGRAYEDGMPGLLVVLYWCVYFLTVHAELWEAEGRTAEFDRQIGRWGRRLARIYRFGLRASRLGQRIARVGRRG